MRVISGNESRDLLLKTQATPTVFTLTVQDSGAANHLALRFANATLNAGHKIEQVFFYHDAVGLADARRVPTQDDPSDPLQWAQLADQEGFPLNVCVAAAQRRGLSEQNQGSLKPGYELVGLGVYVAGLIAADRVVTFSN